MAWLVGVGSALWIFGDSKTFIDCIPKRVKGNDYQALHENAGFFVKAVPRLKLRLACGFEAADANEGALSGLAGIAVAIFTFTLWRSTEKLWREAEAERKGGERARDEDSRRLDWSLEIAQEHAVAADTAANAAKISADAAVWAKMPALRPVVGHGDKGAGNLHALGIITNVGETSALITNVCFVAHVSDPGKPPKILANTSLVRYPPSGDTPVNPEFDLIGDKSFPFTAAGEVPINATIKQLTDGEKVAWIFGYIEYTDFLGVRCRYGFGFNSVPYNPTKDGQSRSLRWARYGEEAFNYHKRGKELDPPLPVIDPDTI